jgi:hypothetical protein
MRDAIYALLSGDATLMATLTGGLHKAAEVGEISRQTTPAAFDANGEIQPCGLLRFGSISPMGPYVHSARLIIALYFYEPKGYQNVDAARERAYVLLHRAKVTPAVGACWEIRHTDDVPDGRDSALECSLAISRFEAVIRRA